MKIIIWALTRPQFDEGKERARELCGRHESPSFVCASLAYFDPSPSQIDQVDGALILEGHANTKKAAEVYEKMGAKVALFDGPGDAEKGAEEPKKTPKKKRSKKDEPEEEATPEDPTT